MMLGSAGKRLPFNAPLALGAGVLAIVAESLLNPIILPVFFVTRLTDSFNAVALVVAVAALGWCLPAMVMPSLTAAAPRQLPWALGATIVRAASVVFLAYLSVRENVSRDDRLRSFFICFIAYSVASGFASGPTNALLGRALQGERRSLVFRQRQFWGGLLAIAAGLAARQTLGPDGPSFPRSVGLLFVAAAAAMCAATFFLARIAEPAALVPEPRRDAALTLRDLLRVLGDGAYRRFALVGAIAALGTLADPFYLVYARQEFKLPADWIGVFLALYAAGVLLSSPLWALLGRVAGARGAIQSAIAIRVIAPLAVLLLPYAIDTDLYREHISDSRVPFYVLAAPFAVFGIATRGFAQGNFRYVLEIAVPQRRAAYQVLALLPMLIVAAAPFLGAWVIDRWGFERLFLIAVFAGFVGTLMAGLLASTHMRVRTVARAWRLRDARP